MIDERTPANLRGGTWYGDPVRDAIVAARLAEMHAALQAHGKSVINAQRRPTTARPGNRLIRRGRLRLGRALVALGAFVEGPSDCGDAATARTS